MISYAKIGSYGGGILHNWYKERTFSYDILSRNRRYVTLNETAISKFILTLDKGTTFARADIMPDADIKLLAIYIINHYHA